MNVTRTAYLLDYLRRQITALKSERYGLLARVGEATANAHYWQDRSEVYRDQRDHAKSEARRYRDDLLRALLAGKP